jgi:predicted kinase
MTQGVTGCADERTRHAVIIVSRTRERDKELYHHAAFATHAAALGITMDLVILIGLQGAGKTTFYRTRFAATHEHVSKDRFRHNKKPSRRQAQLIDDALRTGRSVVVDNTNPTVADRAPLLALGRAHGARISGYYFEPSVSGSLERNREREGRARVPDVAIYATRKKLAPPTYAEGFDTLYEVRIGGNGTFEVQEWTDSDGSVS